MIAYQKEKKKKKKVKNDSQMVETSIVDEKSSGAGKH